MSGPTPPLADAVQRLTACGTDSTNRQRVLTEILAALPGEAVEPFLDGLKAASERQLNLDTHEALLLADDLLAAAERTRRPRHRALGLMARGDALRLRGGLHEALMLYDAAGDACRELGDDVGWARSRTGWLYAMHFVGQGASALAVVDEALAVLLQHEEWLRAAGLSLNSAVVCSELGEYQRALSLYDRALHLYREARQRAALSPAVAETRSAKALSNKANIMTLLGDFRGALGLYADARGTFLRHGDSLSALRVDAAMAGIHAGQGHYARALRVLAESQPILERAGLEEIAARIALTRITCYLALNQLSDALDLATDTIHRYERAGTPTETAKARFYAAQAQARLGDVDAARALLEQAAGTFRVAGLQAEQAIAGLQSATLFLEDERWEEARSAASEARTLFAERGLALYAAQAELTEARAHLALSRPAEATLLAQHALATTVDRGRGALPLAHEAQFVLARASEAGGRLDDALSGYEAAISTIEKTRGRLAADLGVEFLADKLEAFDRAIDLALRLNQPERAFGYLERAKSRAIADYLARHADVRPRSARPEDAPLVDELARLREEHRWFYSRLHGSGLSQEAPSAIGESERALLLAAVRDREKQIGSLVERLALRHASGLEETVTDATETAGLPSDESGAVLLEYYFSGERGLVFVGIPGRLQAVPLAVGTSEVQRLLQRWRLNLDATASALTADNAALVDRLAANARGILETLYDGLIRPVENVLVDARRLVVVPYGVTHGVPFHALSDGTHFLVERLEVAVCPSSRLLRLCADRTRPTTRSALVLAHSDGGRIPQVIAEARSVASVLPGACYLEAQATREVLAANAGRYDVVHIAAHGEARPDNPAFAYLRLADAHLSMVDIFNLDLGGALVTLSACESGQSVVRGGDELIGLSRGFLYAGASALVQSLWRVEDDSTRRLMERFYSEVCDGRPRGAALRTAQRSLLDEAGHALHPYVWAPFQLVGDGGSR